MSPSFVPVEKFCKDHWSAFGYVESCCVDGTDGIGQVDLKKMRCNAGKRPLMGSNFMWRQSWGTRLQGFFEFPDRSDFAKAQAAGLQLLEHDDWDCMDDLEAAGFIEVISHTQGAARMTPLGHEVAAALRKHKCEGGMFATFVWRGAVAAAGKQEVSHA